MRENRLRRILQREEPSVGTHLLSCWPTLVELVGATGHYDYIEFSGEYAPFTLHDLDNLGRAFELAGLGGLIKIEQRDFTHQAMRAVGSGFQGVLFADIRSVEDAQQAVAATRAECPGRAGARGAGLVGVGMRRDVGTVLEGGSGAYVDALNDVVVAIMVEKESCVKKLEDILRVPGIDMVQFGGSDFAMSIGRPGERDSAEVKEAERYTITTALRHGIQPRVEIMDIREAEPYLEMGVRHFCIGWDVRILHQWWKNEGKKMRDVLSGKPLAEGRPVAERLSY